MSEGFCSDYVLLWYFHRLSGECRPFVYGGCGGNQNRFSSRDECQSWCEMERKGREQIKSHRNYMWRYCKCSVFPYNSNQKFTFSQFHRRRTLEMKPATRSKMIRCLYISVWNVIALCFNITVIYIQYLQAVSSCVVWTKHFFTV